MLYTSLAASGFLLVVVFAIFAALKRPLFPVLLGTLIFGFAAAFVAGSEVVFRHGLGLMIAAVLTFAILRRRGLFVPLALLATVVVYGFVCGDAYLQEAALKAEFPAVSLTERLRYQPQPGGPLSADTRASLTQLEGWIDADEESVHDGYQRDRRKALERLHGATREAFVDSPGFGVRRMIPLPQVLNYYVGQHSEPPSPPVPQPSDEKPVAWSPGNPLGELPPWLDLRRMGTLVDRNQQVVRDFVNPAGFGVIVGNRKAIDFTPHQIRSPITRDFDKPLTLAHVDLIGLVTHDQPTAYISASLPSMPELRDAPTRPLDPFEEAGLAELRQGEALFIRELGTQVRMLGAIRAAKQCVDCHGGQRGDLLGAFSYTLKQRGK